jgi:hypothetical protein
MDVDVGKLKRNIRNKIDSLEPEFVEWHNALVWVMSEIVTMEVEANYLKANRERRAKSTESI